MEALRRIDAWDVPHAAAAVVTKDNRVATYGNEEHVFRWASVTKLLTAYALLVALEEGALALDDPAGPEGSTVRHLAAHASGLAFEPEAPAVAAPGRKRIYSNAGYVELAAALERASGMSFERYLREAVSAPLGMAGGLRDEPRGAAAAGYHGPLGDLVALARELLAPTLVAPETLAEATAVVFPGLDGILPPLGRMEPNDWGLGFEIRDGKDPHWTGSRNSPRTYGHFGGAGTFLWVDPDAELALGCLTDREFGDWALEAWPPLADAVLREAGAPSASR